MQNVTLGVFTDRQKAEKTLDDLQAAGIDAKGVSVITKDAAGIKSTTAAQTAATGAVSGATTGAALGGLAGLLIGVGVITLPGIGGLLIGGPLATSLGLTGAAATTASGALTGAAAGGLLGALMGLGLPKERAVIYESSIKEGGIVLAVPNRKTDDTEIKEMMRQNGATEIDVV
jgi:hypothetical protein